MQANKIHLSSHIWSHVCVTQWKNKIKRYISKKEGTIIYNNYLYQSCHVHKGTYPVSFLKFLWDCLIERIKFQESCLFFHKTSVFIGLFVFINCDLWSSLAWLIYLPYAFVLPSEILSKKTEQKYMWWIGMKSVFL